MYRYLGTLDIFVWGAKIWGSLESIQNLRSEVILILTEITGKYLCSVGQADAIKPVLTPSSI